MKKVVKVALIVVLILGVLFAANYFVSTNNKGTVKFTTETPFKAVIEKKTVATGKVIPENEVEIKPQISGIIDRVHVKEGDYINSGDLIATIKVVPNEAALNNAIGRVGNAKIVLKNSEINFNRNKALYEKKVISKQEFDNVELQYNQAQQELTNSINDLKIIREGTAGRGTTNTNVRATISGTILEIPIKAGDQVIESNNFNAGTSIAKIADLGNMVFEGKVDEAEVSRLELGMPLKISLGAIENKEFDAQLRFVAPQGVEENGAVQFKIEATITLDSNFFVRAGYSANATIVLAKSNKVMVIREALLQYNEQTGEPFVELEKAPQQFEKQKIELGLSDGMNVEIISGLKMEDKVKVWKKTEPIKNEVKVTVN